MTSVAPTATEPSAPVHAAAAVIGEHPLTRLLRRTVGPLLLLLDEDELAFDEDEEELALGEEEDDEDELDWAEELLEPDDVQAPLVTLCRTVFGSQSQVGNV